MDHEIKHFEELAILGRSLLKECVVKTCVQFFGIFMYLVCSITPALIHLMPIGSGTSGRRKQSEGSKAIPNMVAVRACRVIAADTEIKVHHYPGVVSVNKQRRLIGIECGCSYCSLSL